MIALRKPHGVVMRDFVLVAQLSAMMGNAYQMLIVIMENVAPLGDIARPTQTQAAPKLLKNQNHPRIVPLPRIVLKKHLGAVTRDSVPLSLVSVAMGSVYLMLTVCQDSVVLFGDTVELTQISVQLLPRFHPQLLLTIMSVIHWQTAPQIDH